MTLDLPPSQVRVLRNSPGLLAAPRIRTGSGESLRLRWPLPRSRTGSGESPRLRRTLEAGPEGSDQGHRRPIADRAMRSHLVVVRPPCFDLGPGVVKVEEPVLVQALGSEPGIETFGERVVGRPARPAEIQDRAVRVGPQVNLLGRELGAVVASNAPRHAVGLD